MPIKIKVENLYKIFGKNPKEALKLLEQGKSKDEILEITGNAVGVNNVSFEVNEGETFVIMGLSGSGKSTLIRCLNLLNKPTKGNISVDGENIVKYDKKQLKKFRQDKMAMVFQHFGLFTHRTIQSNVEYGLEIKKVSKEERSKIAAEAIKNVGLEGWQDSMPHQLSGGMQQRVGLARALANDPDVLLMDEPFSALDPLVKRDMQFELLKIHQKMKRTIIFITHDINEAFKLGDRVAIMRDGKLIQLDTPENMMTNPADDYVRNFIEGADRSQVMSVKNVMITPSTIVWLNDGPKRAIQEMRSNNVSSVYVCSQDMEFKGVITLEGALKLQDKNTKVADHMITDVTSVDAEATIADIMPLAADTKFPIPVLEDGKLIGIVSKASVISTLASDSIEEALEDNQTQESA